MPSRSPTSSFEQPSAMSTTTWRCRSVSENPAPFELFFMPRRYAWRSGATIDRWEYSALDAGDASRAADEARFVPTAVRLVELIPGEGADALEQLELVAQVRSHHLWAVGGDREPDAAVDEHAEHLSHRSLVRKRLCQDLRGRIDLELGLRTALFACELLVARCEDALADPTRAGHLDRLSKLLAAHVAPFFPDMDRDAESSFAGRVDHRLNV